MKQCTYCNEIKDITAFHKAKNTKIGIRSICKKCNTLKLKEWVNKNREKHRATANLYKKNNPTIHRYNCLRIYWPGLTGRECLKKYDEMFEKQNGVCAICNLPETIKHKSGTIYNLSVDHNHTTGKVRELLCANCNHSLGGLKENISFAENLINYLRKHNEN